MPAAETPRQKKAGVISLQIHAGRAEVEQVFTNQLAQLRVRPAGGVAADGEHVLDAVVAQAFAEDTLSHHSRSSEEDHLHERLHDVDVHLFTSLLLENTQLSKAAHPILRVPGANNFPVFELMNVYDLNLHFPVF